MDWKARDMVVAREEAIYICGTEGRGTCYAYEGDIFFSLSSDLTEISALTTIQAINRSSTPTLTT
jgi:hypothetical protein